METGKTKMKTELKNLAFIIMAMLLPAMAPSQSTNETITFTNKAGDVIKDATVIRFDAVKLVYTAGMAGGTVNLADLPDDLQARFGFDSDKAEAADKQNHARRSQEAQAQADQAQVDDGTRQQVWVGASKVLISGHILQRLAGGILVNSGNGRGPNAGGQVFEGLCFVTDYPAMSAVTDGALIGVMAYPNGVYQYPSVSGAGKTVRRFTVCPVRGVEVVRAAHSQSQFIDFHSDPVRMVQGQRHDFYEAIKWQATYPGETCRYPAGSPLAQNWQTTKERYDRSSGWSRYLIHGSIIGTVPEGLVVQMPVTVTAEDGMRRVSKRVYEQHFSTRTVLKQVLVKNVPAGQVKLPIFAVPQGLARIGTAPIEAYDYGMPVREGN